ncbi:MAG: bifunctional demethylmenaquinone methyltransferase/2-methoxy-6-polyprenyl-1,4-benzoquinol methylase UbiE [Gammaproteobacteria bacterium]|jgi:demethylmenaquinone methyltransferase/2-methoxy-6-polyprenyl-1,4-benzoquinol methylase|nr:bifunctional demethylmenaquinone methyltransferase/2-methoxy-6-polyprenyl-1,4-benzoquinol methylase UbiE [Gammaproteobacteria bacterium]
MKDEKKEHDFGFQKVSETEKTEKVTEVFDSVAGKYDLMNDLMSLGIHRFWKKFTLMHTGLTEGMIALDVAGGTGDLAEALAKQVGKSGSVILTDINASMLSEGRNKLLDKGSFNNITLIQSNAEELPFEDNTFDCITIAFGLRNVTNKEEALKSMLNVLKPGGKLLVLEFSKPNELLTPLYDFYSFNVLPKLGEWVANDSDSYKYLAESIRMHPDQDKLLTMINNTGFASSEYFNLTGGIVALHVGQK